jgi:Uma2 family endonuclease
MTTTMQPSAALEGPRSTADFPRAIGLLDNGRLMTPAEFDAITDYDEDYRYELINGVLIVNAAPGPMETDPNGELEFYLRLYMRDHPGVIDKTVYERYIRVKNGRRRADRVIWIGLGRVPNLQQDVPTITVEFVSAGKQNWQRDYVVKRREYLAAGVKEYWVFDRFERRLTVFRSDDELVIAAEATYSTPLLPGFVLPVGPILACAEDWKEEM